MKKITLVIALFLVSGYIIPSSFFTKDPCIVLEKEYKELTYFKKKFGSNAEWMSVLENIEKLNYQISDAFISLVGFEPGNGQIARFIAKNRYPRIPGNLGCVIEYWDSRLQQL